MFKMISNSEYQSVFFAEYSGVSGIENHTCSRITCTKEFAATEKEYNKLRNKVLKLQKAL